MIQAKEMVAKIDILSEHSLEDSTNDFGSTNRTVHNVAAARD
jgi:hypothetical protein